MAIYAHHTYVYVRVDVQTYYIDVRTIFIIIGM